MTAALTAAPSLYQRFLLPGLAFKGVVIGGGYATGRELAEFFLGSGPRGGMAGMILAMLIWSLVCAVAFLFARAMNAYDYRSFFQALLGPFWFVFEMIYLVFLVLILSVVVAAAGTIGTAVFHLPEAAGGWLLIAWIAGVTAFGNRAAEHLFKYTSSFIYVTYAVFLILALLKFSALIGPALAADHPAGGWVLGGISYASYNVVAAVAILPFVRHLTSTRDAVIAGALAGPLAMLPGLLFFLCMAVFYPEIADEALPSDFLLRQMNAFWFQVLFQLMIFTALFETGLGIVNAVNERLAGTLQRRGRALPAGGRFSISALLLIVSSVAAVRIGLVDLIAQGYGAFGWIMLAVFVLPLLVVGIARLCRGNPPSSHGSPS